MDDVKGEMGGEARIRVREGKNGYEETWRG